VVLEQEPVSGIRIDDELGVGQPLRQDNCVHGRDDEVMAPAGGGNRDGGELFVWDLHSGEYFRTLRRDRPYERLDISGVKVLTQAQKASLRALGAIEIVPVTDIQDAPSRCYP
jgi:hypothetical protein